MRNSHVTTSCGVISPSRKTLSWTIHASAWLPSQAVFPDKTSCVSVCFCLFSCHEKHQKNLVLLSLYPPFRYLQTLLRSSLSLPFTRLRSPCSLSFSSSKIFLNDLRGYRLDSQAPSPSCTFIYVKKDVLNYIAQVININKFVPMCIYTCCIYTCFQNKRQYAFFL